MSDILICVLSALVPRSEHVDVREPVASYAHRRKQQSGLWRRPLPAQYVSLNVAPGGLGEPGPLQYLLSTHTLDHLKAARRPACPVEALTGFGDQAIRMTGPHPAAEHERRYRDSHSLHPGLRIARYLDTTLSWTRARLIADAKRRLGL